MFTGGRIYFEGRCVKKAIVLSATLLTATGSPLQAVQAYESSDMVQDSSKAVKGGCTVTRYWLHCGLVQYRRWNETQVGLGRSGLDRLWLDKR